MIDPDLKRKLTPLLRGEGIPFASSLLGGVLRVYGIEALGWDPTTLYMELTDDFDVEIPQKNLDRLLALMNALTTQTVYEHVAVFDETVSALAGFGVGEDRDPPTVLDVAWAVTEIRLSDPEPVGRPKMPWSRNIAKYVRVILDDEGLIVPPAALDFAPQKTLQGDFSESAGLYGDAIKSAQARAEEIDKMVSDVATTMIGQMQYLGLVPTTSSAKAEG